MIRLKLLPVLLSLAISTIGYWLFVELKKDKDSINPTPTPILTSISTFTPVPKLTPAPTLTYDEYFRKKSRLVNIGRHFRWYLTNEVKETEAIAALYNFADQYFEKLSADFDLQFDVQFNIFIHKPGEGVIGTPTPYGHGVQFGVGAVEETYGDIESYWAKRYIAHELVNSFNVLVTPGWPSDWWANHKSPFPTFTHLMVLREMNDPVGNVDMANVVSEDKIVMAFFEKLHEQYGWKIYQKLFKLLKQDQIDLDQVDGDPSILRSHFVATYLSIAAGRNLAADMNGVGIGSHRPDIIKPYKIDAHVINEIIEVRDLLYKAQAEIKPENTVAKNLLEKAWNNFRIGDYVMAQSFTDQALTIAK